MLMTIKFDNDLRFSDFNVLQLLLPAEVAFWWDIPSHEKIPIPGKIPKNWESEDFRKNPQIFKNPQSPG